MDLEAEIDRLYGLPLDEFVRARDELAKSLRREGEREDADRVRALRKPTAGAWALNQAVRRRRKETDALLSAGARLRAAHEALLSGGERSELRDAMAEERDLVAKLADSAEAIASETGKSGPPLRERVRSTLHAAALDEATREALAAGRLGHEQEAVGLGGLEAGSPRAGPKRRGRSATPTSPKRAPPTPKRTLRPAPKPDASARRARQERADALTAATRAVQDARFANDQAKAAQERAAGAVSTARESLREADLGEREARKLAREAERELNRRERELERLRQKEAR